MTDIKKIEVAQHPGSSPALQLQKLAESVNLLQGVTDQDQRAVRMFEFEARMSAIEQRLKDAGI